MIVKNNGYLKLENVLELKRFSIYKTNKQTHILIEDTGEERITLYLPKKDRLPYKLVEGKKICNGLKVFDSEINSISQIDISKWNNGNQIMCYKEFNQYEGTGLPKTK